MTRQEYWKQQYLSNRYMEFLSNEELEERVRNIFTNITVLSPNGQISLHQFQKGGEYWMAKFSHALEEMQLRHGPFPNGFKNGFIKTAEIVKPTYPEPPKAKDVIDQIGGVKPNQLYKFGKHEHISRMLSHGEIRIAPASFYADPSLNKAIRDDELVFKGQSRANIVDIQDKAEDTISTFGKVEFTIKSQTNYFVNCFAANYTFREFDDFDADSCLVIEQPRLFIRKIMKGVKMKKHDLAGFASHVKYLDPLTCAPHEVDIFLAKHFKFSYQNEYRAVWIPSSPLEFLEPFYINIGSMASYAKIVRI